MKSIGNSKVSHALKTLLQVQGEMKVLAIEEKMLKEQIREHMGSETLLETPSAYVMIETRNRTDFDKTAFMHDYGVAEFQKYQKKSEYQIMQIHALVTSNKPAVTSK